VHCRGALSDLCLWLARTPTCSAGNFRYKFKAKDEEQLAQWMVSFSKIPALLRRTEDYFEIGIVRVALSPPHPAESRKSRARWALVSALRNVCKGGQSTPKTPSGGELTLPSVCQWGRSPPRNVFLALV